METRTKLNDSADWPQMITHVNKPWTRWWWLGSSLDEYEITRQLGLFHAAGMGGVEISPIYGVPGYEAGSVPYLSDRWMQLLAFTLQEAARLNMGVDMILGTGWPFGGPTVSDTEVPRKMVWAKPDAPSPPDADLIAQTPGGLRLYLAYTKQQVKRAAPGGEGSVLDHYDAQAVRRYFAGFDGPLSQLPEGGPNLRCVFNDSFEVFGANATPDILTEFARRRGYDLTDYLPALHGSDPDAETVSRVRSDYRETIGDLVRDAFLAPWNEWAHGKKTLTRNQAHGSPGNLLDLYGVCDIPETEVFGPARLALGGMEPLRPAPPDFGREEEALLCKMASSAAHVAGRPLCSSESFTWLGEHGCVPLSHAKAEVDTLFALGINHLFFHGTPHSPETVPWPGWLFYATTHMAPTNTWWDDLPTLNTYIARCQSFLQAGVPDNDVLLYFPFYDLIGSEAGAHDGLQWMTVHKTASYLRGSLPDWCQTAHDLTSGGYAHDFVSDRQLSQAIEATGDGGLRATNGGAEYQTLLLAGCRLMPPETMERLASLAQSGATVCVFGELPQDVPGLANLPERRARFQAAKAALLATGRVHQANELKTLLDQAGVRREAMAGWGLEFTRRLNDDGSVTYFVASPGVHPVREWVSLARPAKALTIYDALTGRSSIITADKNWAGETVFWLEIAPGTTALLRTSPAGALTQIQRRAKGRYLDLRGPWQVTFMEGGPTLPAPCEVSELSSWTTWPDPTGELAAFSGTARYGCAFTLPVPAAAKNDCVLWFREVCYSARVFLNGHYLETLISRPWNVVLPAALLNPEGENQLQIEVTNLMANRMIDLEKRENKAWRPFFLVDIGYKPFENAAGWEPLPSGLLHEADVEWFLDETAENEYAALHPPTPGLIG